MFEITYDNSTPYFFKSAFIELKLLHADHLIDTTPVSCFIRYGEKISPFVSSFLYRFHSDQQIDVDRHFRKSFF